MNRILVPLIVTLTTASCAGAGGEGPAAAASPQTTAISIVGDATRGAGSTVLVTSHRDLRGSNHRVRGMIDEVWRVLPSVYGELGIEVGTVDSGARTMGNARLVMSRSLAGQRLSRYLSCGSGMSGQPIADEYRVEASLLTILHPEEDGSTRVETRLTATAMSRASSGAPLACGSTGRLEARIAEMIALRLTL